MNCCNISFGNVHLVHKLAESNLEFALTLYQMCKDTEKGRGNLLLSPMSISVALAMTLIGARNDTADQIYQALQLEMLSHDEEEIHRSFREVVKMMKIGEEVTTSASTSSDDVCSIKWANKIYLDESYQATKEFSETLLNSYLSEVGLIRMKDNLETTRLNINEWVREVTQDKITNLVPPNTLTSSTRVVVVNAIYFKGVWSIRFEPEKIRPGNFFKKQFEKPVPVMMMENRAALLFHIDYDFKCKIVEIPYAGSSLKMLVFLPFDVDGLSVLERKFNPALINYLKKSMTKARVTLIMPQLKINASVSLRQSLQAMGVKDLFDNHKADLSGMTGTKDLHYFDIVHNAFIDANDGGRIVQHKYASDHLTTSNRRLQELNHLTFLADHPFLFLIYDKSTKMVVFIGRYVDPVAFSPHHTAVKTSPHHTTHLK